MNLATPEKPTTTPLSSEQRSGKGQTTAQGHLAALIVSMINSKEDTAFSLAKLVARHT
jgi:hypothetical protein